MPHTQESGMVNPPRKAKRLRELALKEGPSVTQEFQLPPMPSSRPSSPPAPPRRGRKPTGTLSKSAREQLRKSNHSVIEKRRREKINEALAALRQLVPNDKQQESAEKKDKEEREFKLEILVRTVDYLRSMVDRMTLLEQGLCRTCAGSLREPCLPPTPAIERRAVKRKYIDDEPSEDEHSDYDMLDEPPAREPSMLPRLPSISSWLGQLPSPPQSGPCAPTEVATSSLPNLVLPPAVKIPDTIITMAAQSPSRHLQPCSARTHASDALPVAPSPRHRSNPLEIQSLCHRNDIGPHRPQMPARWSRDEQTAASLLLNISSKRSDAEMSSVQTLRAPFQVYTPRSMLGMPSRGECNEVS